MTRYYAEHAWLPDGVAAGVLLEITDGRFSRVDVTETAPAGSVALPGLSMPGLANAHSHAFHRALRGRTHGAGGSFWTWRTAMYEVAAALDPDSYFRLARTVYEEMALAGITCVGEFHYLHHGPGGARYGEPNAMGEALVDAAAAAGIRITLLDTCYLAAGAGERLRGPQLRFGDGDAAAWAERVGGLRPAAHARLGEVGIRITLLDTCYLSSTVDGSPLLPEQRRFGDRDAERWAQRVSLLLPPAHARVGAAVHSVRAVPEEQIPTVVAWADEREAPLHVHLSEQRAENDAASRCG